MKTNFTKYLIGFTEQEKNHINRLSQFIVDKINFSNKKAFTIDPLTFKDPVFDKRIYQKIYYVSIKVHEQEFDAIPAFSMIRNWITDNYEWLCIRGNYVGFWEHLNHFYLDITKVVYGRKRAILFGKKNCQLAIYCPFTNEEIPIRHNDDEPIVAYGLINITNNNSLTDGIQS